MCVSLINRIRFYRFTIVKPCEKKTKKPTTERTVLPKCRQEHKNTKNDVVVYNRLTLNKMLMDKHTYLDNSYEWLSE